MALSILCPATLWAEDVERYSKKERKDRSDDGYFPDSPYITECGEYDVEKHRENRGLVQLENKVVPHGQWIIGATASYSTHINDEYALTVVNGISSTGYNVTASPVLAYAFKRNMAAGVRFEYSRMLLSLDSAMLSFGEDVNIGIDDYYALQHTYTGMGIFRQYIPLGVSKRFSLFSEIRLEYGYVRAKYAFDQSTENSEYADIKGTFSKGYNVGVSIVPGIVAWVTNDVAFEVTIGMIGVSYTHREQVHNQVSYGEVNTSQLSYGLNIFSIGLGVAFYL